MGGRYFKMLLLHFSFNLCQTLWGHCYHGRIPAITFLAIGPSFKNLVGLWNFDIGVNGNSLKRAIPYKQLRVERNWQNFGTRGSRNCIYICVCRALFVYWFLEFSLRSFDALFKISDVKIFKRLLLTVIIQFQPNFTESIVRNQGGIQATTFSGDLPNLKTYGTLTINHLNYIAIMHKVMWFHLPKGQAERQHPWASCFFFVTLDVIFNFGVLRH